MREAKPTPAQEPVWDEYLEMACLGCAVHSKRGHAGDVLAVLSPDDFYSAENKRIAAAVKSLQDLGEPIEPVSVVARMREAAGKRSELDWPLVAQCIEAGLNTENWAYYATMVLYYSLRRQGIDAAGQIRQMLREGGEIAEIQAKARELSEMSFAKEIATKPLREYLMTVTDEAEQAFTEGKRPSHLDSGIPELDYLTTGFYPGELTIVAARPGQGKSAFGIQMARIAAVHGHGTLIASLEMSGEAVATRMICQLASVDSRKLQRANLSEAEYAAFSEATDQVWALPLRINASPDLSIADIEREAKAIPDLGMVVVDYLQLVKPPKGDTRAEVVGLIAQGLAGMAKRLNCIVMALAQLSREVEHRQGIPKLSDLKESGGIEQAADLVLLLHPQDDNTEFRKVTCTVAKARHGATGSRDLCFWSTYTRFSAWGGAE